MTCYHPMKGWRSRHRTKTGKRAITFNRGDAYVDLSLTVPCGQCIGCRLERSRQWAIRCVHEAQMHEENSFITLTYKDEHLPVNGSLDIVHMQLFMKRLRKYLTSNKYKKLCIANNWNYTEKIRFYACGEYGEKYGRPHYHAIIFGHEFPDKKLFKYSNDLPLYRSASLEALWTMGYSTIGSVTFESAAYVARYLLKKVTGKQAEEYYKKEYLHIDPETGEIFEILFEQAPEYTHMSRTNGIGSTWYKIFMTDVYPSDQVIMNAKPIRPPKYYDGLYEISDPQDFKTMKRRRKKDADHPEDQTTERLKVRESVQKSKLNYLPRNTE